MNQDRLKSLVSYDPMTGGFRWLVDRTRGVRAGDLVKEARSKLGYLRICLDGRRYLSHRVAWLYVTGNWPACDVDHRDRVRDNNRWTNLREATDKQQSENRTISIKNRSGATGVFWRPEKKRWIARIKHFGKIYRSRHFLTFEEAVAARAALERTHFTHAPNCTGAQ
jgi:hypothetical protein